MDSGRDVPVLSGTRGVDGRYALITMCIDGGRGTDPIFERA